MVDRALHLVDPETGEVRTTGCVDCHALKRELERLEHDLDAAEKDLRTKRRQIAALKADKAREREQDPARPVVRRVFEFWQQRCGKARAHFTDDRFDAIKARLSEGYTEAHLMLAVLGITTDPWVRKGERVLEIAWYFDKGSRVEQYANKGARARQRALERRARGGAYRNP